MEFEDSRFALFSEPNAYIQNFSKNENCQPKKVVFQQPYESMPNFYVNNNFKKGSCECVPKRTDNHQNCEKTNNDCNCNHNNKSCNANINQKGFNFDLKSLMPLLGLFNKSGGTDLSQLVGLLNNNATQNTHSNPINLISTIITNKDLMGNILNIFKGGGLKFNKSQPSKKQLKKTDFEIKNYTRVT